MSIDILMPNLGFDTQEARIVEWLKQPGDRVYKGEIIAIVESDKANVELESVADGALLEHRFPLDTMVAVGAVIARVGDPLDDASIVAQTAEPSRAEVNLNVSPIARRIAQENNLDLSVMTGSGAGGRIMRQDVEAILPTAHKELSSEVLALPKVRKAARDAGIELKGIPPTGSSGQVTMADLQSHLQQGRAAIAASEILSQTPVMEGITDSEDIQEVRLSRIRQTIGQRLSKSMQEAPHFYVTSEFDVEDALVRLQSISLEPRPRINDLIQYLTVRTLQKVPQLNAAYHNSKLYRHTGIHLSIAVGLDDGLITPVIRSAERYSLQGITHESRSVVERARAGRLRPDDLQSGTFTISNLGIIKQVDHFTAVVNPPQIAILAVGAVKQRPVVLNGGFHIRNTVKLTLSGDHRVVDGLTLGQFMAAFQAELDDFDGH